MRSFCRGMGLVVLCCVAVAACAQRTYTWGHPAHHDEARMQQDVARCKLQGAQLARYRMESYGKIDPVKELLFGRYVAAVEAGALDCLAADGYYLYEVK